MLLSTHNRALLRGMLAAAVALTGASACSRSDRAVAGRDTTQTGAAAAPSDTLGAVTQPATADTGIATDTVTAATGDSMPADHAMADTAAAGIATDTTAAGYEPMARDTTAVLAQGDTTSQGPVDTTAQMEADTAMIQVQADTSTEAQTELAIEDHPDTVTVVGDSTKTLGQVTTDQANSDVEAVGDVHADAVGAAPVPSTGNIVTGAEAVALVSRGGQPCTVEDSRDARWDMASSPATLNPCSTGTMTLPKVQTGEEK